MHVHMFFPSIFLLPVFRFSIFVFIAVFFHTFCSFMKVKANTVCVRIQASILQSVLAIQSKKLPNCRRRPNDGYTSGQKEHSENKDFGRQTRSRRRIFDKLCEKCFKKDKPYTRNYSARKIGKKLSSTSHYQSFEHNG